MKALKIQWLAVTVSFAVVYPILWVGNQSATPSHVGFRLSQGTSVELKIFSLKARPLSLFLDFASLGHGRDLELGTPDFRLDQPDLSNPAGRLYQPNPRLPVRVVVNLNGNKPVHLVTTGAGNELQGWRSRPLRDHPVSGANTWRYPQCPGESCLTLKAGMNHIQMSVTEVPKVLLAEVVRATSSAPLSSLSSAASYQGVWLARLLASISQAPLLVWIFLLTYKTWTVCQLRKKASRP
jgi:hypothetical protein